jgi:hypothetical protein
VAIYEIVEEIYEWDLHLERCVSCNMECLNKTGLSMNWKCCIHQYIVHRIEQFCCKDVDKMVGVLAVLLYLLNSCVIEFVK